MEQSTRKEFIVKAGFLQKKNKLGVYQKRFFVLKESGLYYYDMAKTSKHREILKRMGVEISGSSVILDGSVDVHDTKTSDGSTILFDDELPVRCIPLEGLELIDLLLDQHGGNLTRDGSGNGMNSLGLDQKSSPKVLHSPRSPRHERPEQQHQQQQQQQQPLPTRTPRGSVVNSTAITLRSAGSKKPIVLIAENETDRKQWVEILKLMLKSPTTTKENDPSPHSSPGLGFPTKTSPAVATTPRLAVDTSPESPTNVAAAVVGGSNVNISMTMFQDYGYMELAVLEASDIIFEASTTTATTTTAVMPPPASRRPKGTFCYVVANMQQFRTAKSRNNDGQDPEWDDDPFCIYLSSFPCDVYVVVMKEEVARSSTDANFDEDNNDKIFGYCKITIDPVLVMNEQVVDDWFPLKSYSADGEGQAEIYTEGRVHLQFKCCFRKIEISQFWVFGGPLFGKGLEDIMQRSDHAEHQLPRVVEECVGHLLRNGGDSFSNIAYGANFNQVLEYRCRADRGASLKISQNANPADIFFLLVMFFVDLKKGDTTAEGEERSMMASLLRHSGNVDSNNYNNNNNDTSYSFVRSIKAAFEEYQCSYSTPAEFMLVHTLCALIRHLSSKFREENVASSLAVRFGLILNNLILAPSLSLSTALSQQGISDNEWLTRWRSESFSMTTVTRTIISNHAMIFDGTTDDPIAYIEKKRQQTASHGSDNTSSSEGALRRKQSVSVLDVRVTEKATPRPGSSRRSTLRELPSVLTPRTPRSEPSPRLGYATPPSTSSSSSATTISDSSTSPEIGGYSATRKSISKKFIDLFVKKKHNNSNSSSKDEASTAVATAATSTTRPRQSTIRNTTVDDSVTMMQPGVRSSWRGNATLDALLLFEEEQERDAKKRTVQQKAAAAAATKAPVFLAAPALPDARTSPPPPPAPISPLLMPHPGMLIMRETRHRRTSSAERFEPLPSLKTTPQSPSPSSDDSKLVRPASEELIDFKARLEFWKQQAAAHSRQKQQQHHRR